MLHKSNRVEGTTSRRTHAGTPCLWTCSSILNDPPIHRLPPAMRTCGLPRRNDCPCPERTSDSTNALIDVAVSERENESEFDIELRASFICRLMWSCGGDTSAMWQNRKGRVVHVKYIPRNTDFMITMSRIG